MGKLSRERRWKQSSNWLTGASEEQGVERQAHSRTMRHVNLLFHAYIFQLEMEI